MISTLRGLTYRNIEKMANKIFNVPNHLNPLSPKIDFYVDLLICATSWASNHKFMLLSKIFQETYYLWQYITLSF